MDEVVKAVEEGNSIGSVLTGHPLVPRTMASAIATGEQSGQLGESLLFLAGYMEEENTQTLGTLTRMIEPIILVIMGATVGRGGDFTVSAVVRPDLGNEVGCDSTKVNERVLVLEKAVWPNRD